MTQELRRSAELMYENMRGNFTGRLEELESLQSTFEESNLLTGGLGEEYEELLESLLLEKGIMESVLSGMNDVKTRDWYIDMVTEALEKEVTPEELAIVDEAIGIQERIEEVISRTSMELFGYLGKDLDEKVVVN